MGDMGRDMEMFFFVKMDEDVRNSGRFRRWNLFDIPRLGFQSVTQFFHQN